MGDLVPLRRSGSKPPLFCIYGILLYQDLVTHLDPEQPVYGVFLQEEIELVKTGKFDQQNSAFASVPSIAARYLQAIRAFQPQGPYHLAGESFGGVVAFEMAQQLRASGEDVALVALFDSWMLNISGRMSLIRRLKLHLKLLSKHRLSYCTKMGRQYTASIRRLLSTQLYKYQQLHSLVETVAEATQQDIRNQVQQRASQSYVPAPYNGKIVLFRAMERDAFDVDLGRDLGWKPLAAGDFHIFDVPGDHLGILKDPNVQVLAEQLQLHLQQYDLHRC